MADSQRDDFEGHHSFYSSEVKRKHVNQVAVAFAQRVANSYSWFHCAQLLRRAAYKRCFARTCAAAARAAGSSAFAVAVLWCFASSTHT